MLELHINENITKCFDNNIINFIFKISLFLLLIIPASLGTSAKLIFIVCLFLLCFLKRLNEKQFVLFILISILNLFFLVYSLTRINLIDDLSIRAFLSYQGVTLTTFALVWGSHDIKKEIIFKVFAIGISLYCLIKLVLIFTPQFSFLAAMNPGFVMDLRDPSFLRIATSNDILLPFAFFLVLNKKFFNLKLGFYLSTICLIVIVIVGVLTFTRYIWMSMLVVALCYMVFSLKFEMLNLNRFKFIVTSITLMVSIMPLYFVLDVKALTKFIFIRFADLYSIHIKTEQAGYLITGFANAPLLGAGNSAFIDNYIRYERLPFVYETQWIAVLYQFGLIGAITIATLLFLPIFPILKYVLTHLKFPKASLVIFILYILFLLSGFTNPNLFTLNSSVVYFIVYLVSLFCIDKQIMEV